MKIKELLPDNIVTIAKHIIQGRLTAEERQFLKETCKFELTQSYFCDDGSIELEIVGPNGAQTIDLSNPPAATSENQWILLNYHTIALFQTIVLASNQLPKWVYDDSKFTFNWALLGSETLNQFNEAFDRVWNMVFDGQRDGWRSGREHLDNLESLILDQMFGVTHSKDSWDTTRTEIEALPIWLRDESASIPLDKSLIEQLTELHQLYASHGVDILKGLPGLASVYECYVSPFTGKQT